MKRTRSSRLVGAAIPALLIAAAHVAPAPAPIAPVKAAKAADNPCAPKKKRSSNPCAPGKGRD